jgi:AcrR family transcriptional regulator
VVTKLATPPAPSAPPADVGDDTPAPSKRASALPPEERRSMIVRTTLPLLLAHGEMVTTRQIADAAGIAEGTIFRAFADKEELIAAVVEAALDTAPLEQALGGIDPDQPFEDRLVAATQILQRRTVDIWRLVSSIGHKVHDASRRPADSPALIAVFEDNRDRLSVEPVVAARLLRALTLSMTHPSLVDSPMSPSEIVEYFLHGVHAADRAC